MEVVDIIFALAGNRGQFMMSVCKDCTRSARGWHSLLSRFYPRVPFLHLQNVCNGCMQAVSKTDQVLSLKRYIGKCPFEVDRIMEQLTTTRKQQAFLHR